jgi:lipopolysaccharide/colanic/teichoic acid biosynthesis glycosyltransferase
MIANYHKIQANDTMIPTWKRVLDIALILLLLPLILVVGGGVALIIRLVSRGPVFFRQERVGHLGKSFMILKFRTMRVGADTSRHQGHVISLLSSDTPMMKLDARGDSRIIPFGTWIRAAGLDELPQLINVLRGEMSLVGPRPCLPFESAQYQAWQKERFNTLPGLTGLWQVSGKNNTTFLEMIQYDIEYSRTKSLGLDLEIILRTFPALFIQMVQMHIRRPQPVARPVATPVRQPEFACGRPSRRHSTFPARSSAMAPGRNARSNFRS